MKISNRWLKWFKREEDKEVFKQQFIASRDVLDTLIKILEEDLEASTRSMRKAENYELPSWKEFVSDKLGEQRTYQKLIDFLKEK